MAIGAPSKLRFTRKAEALAMMCPTLALFEMGGWKKKEKKKAEGPWSSGAEDQNRMRGECGGRDIQAETYIGGRQTYIGGNKRTFTG